MKLLKEKMLDFEYEINHGLRSIDDQVADDLLLMLAKLICNQQASDEIAYTGHIRTDG